MTDPEAPLALVGGTIIDGTGGRPLADAALIIEGGKIRASCPRRSVAVPSEALTVDVTGKFVLPGLIDTNVHLTLLFGATREFYETLVRYMAQNESLAVAAAQLYLRHGVTTVRDSYGVLSALTAARDSIASGAAVGARILAAGNIVGWGGPFSVTFGGQIVGARRYSGPVYYPHLTRFEQECNELIIEGSGEDLLDMTLPELAAAIDAYLDNGPDFIKYGGTAHWSYPNLIGFSGDAQRVIVERAHRRGLSVETHATSPESLRAAVGAGVDLIQHPEMLRPAEIDDDLVELIRDRKVICSMVPNRFTGAPWSAHLDEVAAARPRHEAEDLQRGSPPPTPYLRRQRHLETDGDLELSRRNAQKLIAAGCIVTIGSDSFIEPAPEFTVGPRANDWYTPGLATVRGLEGLVEIGVPPSAALAAATRNGAVACRAEANLGTLEPGKVADAIVLDADPLADIANVRRVSLVVSRGRIVDLAGLPERSAYERVSSAS